MAEVTAKLVKELRDRTSAAMMDCKKVLVEAEGDIEAAIILLRKKGMSKAAKKADRVTAQGTIVIAQSDDAHSAVMVEINCETDFVARDENFVGFAAAVADVALAEKCVDSADLMTKAHNGATIEDARKELVNKLGENMQVRRAALVESEGSVGQYRHGDRIGVLVSLDCDNNELAKDIAMHIAASKPQAINSDDVDADVIAKEREIYLDQAKSTGKPQEIIDKMVDGRVQKFLKEVSLEGQPFVKDPNQSVGALLKANSAKVTGFVRFEVGEGIEVETVDFADEVMAQVKGSE